jgi:predicted RNA methylase
MANRKTQQTEREKEFEVNLTPRGVVKQGLLYLKEKQGLDVKSLLDFSAGSGVYCSVVRELWPTSDIVAVEPREEQREVLLKAGANDISLT